MKKIVIFHICALPQLYVKVGPPPPWKNFLDPRLSPLSFLKSDVIPTVSDHLGQATYQRSDIAVAVKGMLVEQIGHKNDKAIAKYKTFFISCLL